MAQGKECEGMKNNKKSPKINLGKLYSQKNFRKS